jgi:hypothetical protein
MLPGENVNQRTSDADQAAIAEMRETRSLAISGAVDAVASRAIGLRVDLTHCMDENRQLRARVRELELEIAGLKRPKRRRGNAS